MANETCRIHATRLASSVAYLGPPAQTQVLLFELVTIVKQVVCVYHPKFNSLHPTLGW